MHTMQYVVTAKVVTFSAWKCDKKVKNVFTEVTFYLGIKNVSGFFEQRNKDTLNNMTNI